MWGVNRYIEYSRRDVKRDVKTKPADNTKVMDHIRVVHYLFQKVHDDGSPRFIRPHAIGLDLSMDPHQVGRILTGLVGDVDGIKTPRGYRLSEMVDAIEKKMANAGRMYMYPGGPINHGNVADFVDANGNSGNDDDSGVSFHPLDPASIPIHHNDGKEGRIAEWPATVQSVVAISAIDNEGEETEMPDGETIDGAE